MIPAYITGFIPLLEKKLDKLKHKISKQKDKDKRKLLKEEYVKLKETLKKVKGEDAPDIPEDYSI